MISVFCASNSPLQFAAAERGREREGREQAACDLESLGGSTESGKPFLNHNKCKSQKIISEFWKPEGKGLIKITSTSVSYFSMESL